MKKIFVLLLIFFASYLVYSYNKEDEHFKHYIGGAFGMTTGYGLSYRYWPGSWGFQGVFSPYWQNDEVLLNLGICGFKTLYESTNTRLFLYLAANETYNYKENEEETEFNHSFGFATGIGPGIEIYILKHIALDIMFGYSYTVGDTFFDAYGVGFTAEVALYYRF